MEEALVDTDILSYYLKGDEKVVKKFHEYLHHFDRINISIITFYELLGGLKHKNSIHQLLKFEMFINDNNVIYISELSARNSANIYSELRERGITIGTSDTLIAGIAIENELTLITNNVKHFETVKGLKIENWKMY